MTPLWYAANCEYPEVAELLVRNFICFPATLPSVLTVEQLHAGANPDIEDNDGEAPAAMLEGIGELQHALATARLNHTTTFHIHNTD